MGTVSVVTLIIHLVPLQVLDREIFGALVVILRSMLATALVQPAHGPQIDPYQPGCTFEPAAITQMLADQGREFLRNLPVPQGRVPALTEFFPAVPAALKADRLVLAVRFPNCEIVGTGLTVQLTIRVVPCSAVQRGAGDKDFGHTLMFYRPFPLSRW
jgi:hypothetical protein